MGVWPEVVTAKTENRHEIKLAGAAISKRISEEGLDSTIFQLTNINLLNISDTCLTTIPDAIKHLTNLQSLLLFGNKIVEFNENITSLPKLKVLDLSRNQITNVPDSLNNIKDLTNINFSFNQINVMPKLLELPNLITVDISHNKLTEFLDVENANLPHLTDLNLKGNVIGNIPNYISKSLPSLKNLDLGDNQIKSVPGEMSNLSKLKELNLKGNKLTDKRLMKLVDQCRTKQVLDYVREHCPRADQGEQSGKGKNKKGGKKKEEVQQEDNLMETLCHSLKIMHVEDDVPRVKIMEAEVTGIRPFILCCIITDLNFTDVLFKKFIQMQTKLHDTVCDKRNVATIATHDFSKIPTGDLTYTAKSPAKLVLWPLGKPKPCTGDHLFQLLTAEADALRKEKKRNVYSGIHKYLYLLEGKSKYPCLQDSSGKVISFPPITNSEETKMSVETKSIFVEVTSQCSVNSCRSVMDRLLQELLLLGVGGASEAGEGYHSLAVQQVKVVDLEGNLKSVYPSRTDCLFEGAANITVLRLPKK